MLNQMWFSRGSLNVMQSFSNINVRGSSVWVLLRQHMARGQCRSSPRDPPFTRMAFFTGAAFSPKDAPSFSPPLFSSSQHCPPTAARLPSPYRWLGDWNHFNLGSQQRLPLLSSLTEGHLSLDAWLPRGSGVAAHVPQLCPPAYTLCVLPWCYLDAPSMGSKIASWRMERSCQREVGISWHSIDRSLLSFVLIPLWEEASVF